MYDGTIVMTFDKPVTSSQQSTIRVRDQDGTVVDFCHGGGCANEFGAGDPSTTMLIQTTKYTISSAGSVTGLQYPLTIIDVNGLADASGAVMGLVGTVLN